MSLRNRAVTGVKWMSSSMAVTVVLNFAQTVILSRLLEPRDFGLVGMAWVYLGFLELFADAGVSNALIQRQNATKQELSSVYWLTVFAGLALAVIIVSTRPLVVAFYHEPGLAPLLSWLALTFIVTAAGQPFRMILQRELHFNRLAVVDISGAFIGLLVATLSAWYGLGPQSLVNGGLAAVTTKTMSCAIQCWHIWRPSLHFHLSELRPFLRWGSLQVGDRTMNYISVNADYLMVGHFLGAGPLGVYRVAFEMVARPVSTVNPILNSVAYPLYARKQNDPMALRRGVAEVARLIANVVFPLMFGLLAVSQDAVITVFGPKWLEAVPLIRIMSLMGALRSLSNPVGALLQALGKLELSLFWNGLQGVLNPIIFYFVAPLGVGTVAWTWLGLFGAIFVISWKSLYASTIQMRPREYFGNLWRPLLFSCIMCASVVGLGYAIAPFAWPAQARLALMIPAGAAIYIGLQLSFQPSYLRELKASIAGRHGSEAQG